MCATRAPKLCGWGMTFKDVEQVQRSWLSVVLAIVSSCCSSWAGFDDAPFARAAALTGHTLMEGLTHRVSHAHRAHVGVGFVTILVCAAAERFRAGQQLHMRLNTNDSFILQQCPNTKGGTESAARRGCGMLRASARLCQAVLSRMCTCCHTATALHTKVNTPPAPPLPPRWQALPLPQLLHRHSAASCCFVARFVCSTPAAATACCLQAACRPGSGWAAHSPLLLP